MLPHFSENHVSAIFAGALVKNGCASPASDCPSRQSANAARALCGCTKVLLAEGEYRVGSTVRCMHAAGSHPT